MVYLVALSIFILDYISKNSADREGLVVLNQGISFGWLDSVSPEVLGVILLVVTVALIGVLHSFKGHSPIAKGLFLGGALGNLLDRGMHGGVRDWLPIPGTSLLNNLADYAICGSVIWLILEVVVRSHHSQHDN